MSFTAAFEIHFTEDKMILNNTTNLSQTQFLGGEKLLLLDQINLSPEQYEKMLSIGFQFETANGDKVVIINKRNFSDQEYMAIRPLGDEVAMPTVANQELEITFPDQSVLVLSTDTGLDLSSEKLEIPFDASNPHKDVVITCQNIQDAISLNPTSGIFLIQDTPSKFPYKEFPDGVYHAKLSFDLLPDFYAGAVVCLNTDSTERRILEKIDPSAGFYTQYKQSEEERKTLEKVSELLMILEAIRLDFGKGFYESVKMKLSVMDKLIKLCPVFKCSQL